MACAFVIPSTKDGLGCFIDIIGKTPDGTDGTVRLDVRLLTGVNIDLQLN